MLADLSGWRRTVAPGLHLGGPDDQTARGPVCHRIGDIGGQCLRDASRPARRSEGLGLNRDLLGDIPVLTLQATPAGGRVVVGAAAAGDGAGWSALTGQ